MITKFSVILLLYLALGTFLSDYYTESYENKRRDRYLEITNVVRPNDEIINSDNDIDQDEKSYTNEDEEFSNDNRVRAIELELGTDNNVDSISNNAVNKRKESDKYKANSSIPLLNSLLNDGNREQVREMRNRVIDNIWNITADLNILYYKKWLNMTNEQLLSYEYELSHILVSDELLVEFRRKLDFHSQASQIQIGTSGRTAVDVDAIQQKSTFPKHTRLAKALYSAVKIVDGIGYQESLQPYSPMILYAVLAYAFMCYYILKWDARVKPQFKRIIHCYIAPQFNYDQRRVPAKFIYCWIAILTFVKTFIHIAIGIFLLKFYDKGDWIFVDCLYFVSLSVLRIGQNDQIIPANSILSSEINPETTSIKDSFVLFFYCVNLLSGIFNTMNLFYSLFRYFTIVVLDLDYDLRFFRQKMWFF